MERLKQIESRYNASLEVSEKDFEWLVKEIKEKEQLKVDLFQWKKWYEQVTGFPATKN